MKALATNIRLQFNEDRRPEIVLTLQTAQDIAELRAVTKAGKLLSVECKAYRAHRSLNSNAYFWTLLEKLSAALRTTKDELYLLMLERYGVFTHVIVKPVAVERIMAEWRTVRNLGEVTVGTMNGVQLQCYFGSSTYNTQEMARLIDGVIDECKQCGIETLPPDEVAAMNREWNRSV